MHRVLTLVYTPTYGGPHNQIVELYEPLLSRGWETIALLPETDHESYARLSDKGITVLTRSLKRIRAKDVIQNNLAYISDFRKNVNQIKKIIKEYKIDVVQVCGLMHIHAAFACKELGVPLVWQFLGTFAPLPLRILYTPFASYYADHIMTTGMRTAKQHVFYNLFRHKHTIFYPPVDTNRFSYSIQKKNRAREWMNVPKDAFLVGTVGNQNKTKRHEHFLDIANTFLDDKDIYFRIVGKHTPSHAEYYKKEVIDKAHENKLFQNGKLEIKEDELSIDTIMAGFDIFLLTSRIEGLPTVILEAMSIGLPIVTNDVGSISEVIENEKQGYIYDSLAEASSVISRLKEEAGLYQEISQINRQEAQKKYDTKVCAEKHANVYNLLIS